jgi:hypothetical protein
MNKLMSTENSSGLIKPALMRTPGRIILVTDDKGITYRIGTETLRRFRSAHPDRQIMFDKINKRLVLMGFSIPVL